MWCVVGASPSGATAGCSAAGALSAPPTNRLRQLRRLPALPQPYTLSKQEVLHLINARPQTEVELYTASQEGGGPACCGGDCVGCGHARTAARPGASLRSPCRDCRV